MIDQSPLHLGTLHWFADWPVGEVPRYAAGVYTVWDRVDRFIYVGMSGRGMKTSDIQNLERQGGRPRGLWERLNSHASGRRSGDQFCVYVADRLVLPSLSTDEIEAVGTGASSMDAMVRDYIRSELGFRFVIVDDGRKALEMEREVQGGSLVSGRPLLNPL